MWKKVLTGGIFFCFLGLAAAAGPTDIAVTKKTTVIDPFAGSSIEATYEIAVTNKSSVTAQQVWLGDVLPEDLIYDSLTAPFGVTCNVTGNAISCDLADIAPRSTKTIFIKVKADIESKTSSVMNTVTVGSITPDSDTSNNTAISRTPSRQIADISLKKTTSKYSPNEGEEFTYSVVLSNRGPRNVPGTVNNGQVIDTLPSDIEFVSISNFSGFSKCNYDPVSHKVTCDLDKGAWAGMGVGRLAAVDIKVKPKKCGSIINIAQFISPGTDFNAFDKHASDNQNAQNIFVPCISDLSLTKTVDNPNPLLNSDVTFTIKATNSGPATATNVIIADKLPAGLDYKSHSTLTGTYNSLTGAWSIASLAPKASAELKITATVKNVGTLTNIAKLTKLDQTDPDPNNNEAKASVTVQAADLQVTKVGTPTIAIAGQNITYTINVINQGSLTATNVVVTDVLTTPLVHISSISDKGNCNFSPPITIKCDSFSLNNGEQAKITINARVPADFAGDKVENKVNVTSDTPDPDPTNNNATATNTVERQADLSITKSGQSVAPILIPGGLIDYTITVTNNGPSNAPDIKVTDAINARLDVVMASLPAGCSLVGAQIECDFKAINLKPSDTKQIKFQVKVKDPVADCSDIKNEAAVALTTVPNAGESAIKDPNMANNTGQSNSLALNCNADLELKKELIGNPTPAPGDKVTFKITLTNKGPNPANVTVKDLLPADLGFVSAKTSQGTYNNATGLWNVGNMAVGSSTLEIVATVNAIKKIENIAEVWTTDRPDPDSKPGNSDPNEDDQDSAEVNSVWADVEVIKTGPVNVIAGQDIVIYTIKVINNGPTVANDVILTDNLPNDLGKPSIVVTAPLKDKDCSLVLDTITCNIGKLNPGESREITVSLSVPGSYSLPTIVNTAVVSTTTYEPNAKKKNNESTVTTTVGKLADIIVQKTGPSSAKAGDEIVYTIKVANTGLSDAENVIVNDPTPAGLTFISNTGSCNAPYPCNLGKLMAGQTLTISSRYKIDQNWKTDIVNTALVTTDTPESNKDNNSDSWKTRLFDDNSDVSIVKIGPASAKLGDKIVYKIIVTNNGPSEAKNVVVTDELPQGLDLLTYSNKCNKSGLNLVCQLGDLAKDAQIELTVEMMIPKDYSGTKIVKNTALVSNEKPIDPDLGNNTSTVTTEITDFNDYLTDLVIKKLGPATAKPGDTLEYTINVTNTGKTNAKDVIVTDTLPDGLQNPSVEPKDICTVSDKIITCKFSNLEAGASQTITVKATLSKPYNGPNKIKNIAVVTTTTSENPKDNTSEVTTEILPDVAELTISKTASVNFINVGGEFSYIITINNPGSTTATDVELKDAMPEGIEAIKVDTNRGSCSITNNTVNCKLDDLKFGEKAIVNIKVKANKIARTVNIAIVDGSNTDPKQNDPDSSQVNVGISDLFIEKTALQKTASIGQIIDFDITITNTSNKKITDINVVDILPKDLIYQKGSSKLNGKAFNEPQVKNDNLEWLIGTLEPKQSAKISIKTLISALANQTIVNRAKVIAGKMEYLAEETVKLTNKGIFIDKPLLIGYVFFDANDNGVFDAGDRPINNARIYLSTSFYVLTDEFGRYSIETSFGSLALRLDPSSLPANLTASPMFQDLGSPGSVIMNIGDSLIYRLDFPVRYLR